GLFGEPCAQQSQNEFARHVPYQPKCVKAERDKDRLPLHAQAIHGRYRSLKIFCWVTTLDFDIRDQSASITREQIFLKCGNPFACKLWASPASSIQLLDLLQRHLVDSTSPIRCAIHSVIVHTNPVTVFRQ